jgi:DNA polymerase III delta subunit
MFNFIFEFFKKIFFFTGAVKNKSSFKKPLSPEEEQRHLLLARNGDKNSREILIERNMNDKDIARTLGEKEFRIKKTRELVPLYTEKEILSLMQRLANIDLKIKTTDTNPKTEIELFILNI